jgi:dienelactone hydrolase
MVGFLKRFLKYLLYAIAGILGLTATFVVYLMWLQPPFYFPKPTGAYAIGVKEYHWIDEAHKETFANDPAHPYRELMVKIWYPAQGTLTETPTTAYAADLVNHLKKTQKLLWLFGFSRPVYTYALPAAPIAASSSLFPVIIFSHGHPCAPEVYTVYCEELASNGYVVIGINHAYGSVLTQFPDGRQVGDGAFRQQQASATTFTQAKKHLDATLETWAADVQFVLDQLEKNSREKESLLYQHLDLQRIGMFGHSLGGATAIQMCRRDARIKAGVNLDGGLFGKDPAQPFKKPCLFMLSENFAKTSESPLPQSLRDEFKIRTLDEEKIFKFLATSNRELAQALKPDAYLVVIKNAGHMDFMDLALLKNASPFTRLLKNLGSKSILGSIDGFRATEIVNAYLVNFFDKYLKGTPSQLLDGTEKRYVEIELS